MKLDIEGSEFDVLARMLERKAFCGPRHRAISLLAMETHLVFLSQTNGRLVPCDSLPKCRDAQGVLERLRARIRATDCTSTRLEETDVNEYEFDSQAVLPIDDVKACSARHTRSDRSKESEVATSARRLTADDPPVSAHASLPRPWQCDLLPALVETTDCTSHGKAACSLHYIRGGGGNSFSRCLTERLPGAPLRCVAGPSVYGCPPLPAGTWAR